MIQRISARLDHGNGPRAPRGLIVHDRHWSRFGETAGCGAVLIPRISNHLDHES
jgi:hypothetical protein